MRYSFLGVFCRVHPISHSVHHVLRTSVLFAECRPVFMIGHLSALIEIKETSVFFEWITICTYVWRYAYKNVSCADDRRAYADRRERLKRSSTKFSAHTAVAVSPGPVVPNLRLATIRSLKFEVNFKKNKN